VLFDNVERIAPPALAFMYTLSATVTIYNYSNLLESVCHQLVANIHYTVISI